MLELPKGFIRVSVRIAAAYSLTYSNSAEPHFYTVYRAASVPRTQGL